MQFIGHYIEGNRPPLMDNLTSAVSQAPLFSVMYLFQTIDWIIENIKYFLYFPIKNFIILKFSISIIIKKLIDTYFK